MKSSYYHPLHYPMVAKWWKEQNWPVIPENMLPSRGLIVNDDGEMICAGWMYDTDSALGIMEWIVRNPHIEHERASLALDCLINDLAEMGKQMGKKALISFVKHPRLMERYKKHQFSTTDEGMVHFVRNL